MPLIPIQDRVLLEKLEVMNPKAEGIITPDGIKERPVVRCRVIAVGPGKLVRGRLIKPSVKAGDIIVFNQYDQSVVELEEAGKRYLLVREDDLLCAESLSQ